MANMIAVFFFAYNTFSHQMDRQPQFVMVARRATYDPCITLRVNVLLVGPVSLDVVTQRFCHAIDEISLLSTPALLRVF